MSRKKRFRPPSWQSDPTAKNQHFVQLYASMMDSPAFTDLSLRARGLYLFAARQTYGEASKDAAEAGKPYDGALFYCNAELLKRAKMYSNRRTFEQDMAALISHGFCDCVSSGYRHGRNAKSIYRMSSRWLSWGTDAFEVPESAKTAYMRRTENQ